MHPSERAGWPRGAPIATRSTRSPSPFEGRRGPHRSASRCRGRPIELHEAGAEGCLWPDPGSQGRPPDGSGLIRESITRTAALARRSARLARRAQCSRNARAGLARGSRNAPAALRDAPRPSAARALREPRARGARASREPCAKYKSPCVWSRFRCLFGSFGEEHELVAPNRSKKNEQKTSEP